MEQQNLTEEMSDYSDSAEPDAHIGSVRQVEAILFSSKDPISKKDLASFVLDNVDLELVLKDIEAKYQFAGFRLEKSDMGYAFRTAPDLAHLFTREDQALKPLSKAALETLSIIAYHQPTTRAEIEQIRGVATSKGTLDVLLEAEFIRMRGRRDSPGRPITYGTTAHFLDHFELGSIKDLPGVGELKAAGLLSSQIPPDFSMPKPNDDEALDDDEMALDDEIEPLRDDE